MGKFAARQFPPYFKRPALTGSPWRWLAVFWSQIAEAGVLDVISLGADHAASAEEVIESARMTQEVADTALRGNPDMTCDPAVQQRKHQLIEQTWILLESIRQLGTATEDPFSDPVVLARAVALGLMDAPQLVSNRFAPGRVRTRSIHGAIRAVDHQGHPLDEQKRIAAVLSQLID